MRNNCTGCLGGPAATQAVSVGPPSHHPTRGKEQEASKLAVGRRQLPRLQNQLGEKTRNDRETISFASVEIWMGGCAYWCGISGLAQSLPLSPRSELNSQRLPLRTGDTTAQQLSAPTGVAAPSLGEDPGVPPHSLVKPGNGGPAWVFLLVGEQALALHTSQPAG